MKRKVPEMKAKRFMQKDVSVINQDVRRNIVNVTKLEFFVLLYASVKIAKTGIKMNYFKIIELFSNNNFIIYYYFIIFSEKKKKNFIF